MNRLHEAKGSQITMTRLLVVDDEKSICQMLEIAFRKEGMSVETASSGKQAQQKIESQVYDLIISDIRMPDLTGIELLEHMRRSGIPTPFVLMTAVPSISTAVDALNLGADRYVIKSDRLIDDLKVVVRNELKHLALKEENRLLRREMLRIFSNENIVGKSSKIQAILEMVRTVAATTSTILITGESGTGKELVARAIHEASPRREGNFISINCGAFPETLLESELFGYFRGAFTGAFADKKGIFEEASGGTLFLDEIGETTPSMQVKLLRALQERRIRPLGGNHDLPVDVRLIASTNRNLRTMVEEKAFREDFYYRVSVILIHVPPLRERADDIEPLARHFLAKYSLKFGKSLNSIEGPASDAMRNYGWPGNVRELENAIERAVAVSGENERVLRLGHLPESIVGETMVQSTMTTIPKEGLNFEAHLAEIEKKYLRAALDVAGGVRTRAAELLRMSYRSFRHYAKKHGI